MESGQSRIPLRDHLAAFLRVEMNRHVLLIFGGGLLALIFRLLALIGLVVIEPHPKAKYTTSKVFIEIQKAFSYRPGGDGEVLHFVQIIVGEK